MKFFKHFTDAHRGQSLQSVKNRLGFEGIGRYWILVEMCAEKMTKNPDEEYSDIHCTFTYHRRYLRDTLGTHQLSGVEKFLRCLADVGLMSYTSIDDVVEIYMPKLLDSLDRDTKRARTERVDSAPKRKSKEEEKEIEEEKEKDICAEPSNLVPLVQPSQVSFKISSSKEIALKRDLVTSWADTYPKEFLDLEIKKARSWILANPQKAPKSDWGRFFNNWFNRGWEQYRKTLKSNPSAISIDDLNEMLGAS